MIVKFNGTEKQKQYIGFDDDFKKDINVKAGETATVSSKKGAQLVADFGKLFSVISGVGTPVVSSKAVKEFDKKVKELQKQEKELAKQLNEIKSKEDAIDAKEKDVEEREAKLNESIILLDKDKKEVQRQYAELEEKVKKDSETK